MRAPATSLAAAPLPLESGVGRRWPPIDMASVELGHSTVPTIARGVDRADWLHGLLGDEVITTSGLYGVITGEDGDSRFWLEIDDDVQVRIARAAISGKASLDDTDDADDADDDDNADESVPANADDDD